MVSISQAILSRALSRRGISLGDVLRTRNQLPRLSPRGRAASRRVRLSHVRPCAWPSVYTLEGIASELTAAATSISQNQYRSRKKRGFCLVKGGSFLWGCVRRVVYVDRKKRELKETLTDDNFGNKILTDFNARTISSIIVVSCRKFAILLLKVSYKHMKKVSV